MSSTTAPLLIPTLTAGADGRFDAARAQVEEGLALGVGGFRLRGGDSEAVRALAKELQQRARHKLLVGATMERGAGQQFAGATGLPPVAAIVALDDLEALRRAARLTAREARTMGVNWNFAPVLDLDVEPDSPAVGARALGDDPARVARLAAAWIESCQAEGVLACAKHFPGLGRAVGDAHQALPVVGADRETLHAQELAPFRAAIAANVASMMTAHVAYPALDPGGLPATLSREIMTWLLRQQLRYDGLVVSDALHMAGVRQGAADEGEIAVRAIAAGCDLLLAPQDLAGTVRTLDAALASGVLDPQRVQTALRRRLKWAQWAAPPNDWRRPSAADAAWGTQLADRVVRMTVGDAPPLGATLELVVVDDDLASVGDGVPATNAERAPARREALAETLRTAGCQLVDGPGAPVHAVRLVALFGEVRPGKGRAGYAPATLDQVRAAVDAARAAGRRALVVQFGPPRSLATLGADVPVLCAWSGDRAMQQAAGRWLLGRRGAA